MLGTNIVSEACSVTEELALRAADVVVEHSRGVSMDSSEMRFLMALKLGDYQDEAALMLHVNIYLSQFSEETVLAFCKLFLEIFPITYSFLNKLEQQNLKMNLFNELLGIPMDNVHGFLHENNWNPRRHYTASMLKILFQRTAPAYNDVTPKEEIYLRQQFKIPEPNEWSESEKYERRREVRNRLYKLFNVFAKVAERYGFSDTKVFIKYLLDKKERNKKIHLTEEFRSAWKTRSDGTDTVGSFDSFLTDILKLPIESNSDHLSFTKSYKHRCVSQADNWWFKANDDVLVHSSAVGNSTTNTLSPPDVSNTQQSNTEDAMVEAKFLRKIPSTQQPDNYIIRLKNPTVTNQINKTKIQRPPSPY